jgi:hypothetical protein
MDNSSHSQRLRIFNRLKEGPITTLQARKELDTLHPAARVMELRRRGVNILTHWDTDFTDSGEPHRVARYVLISEQGVKS